MFSTRLIQYARLLIGDCAEKGQRIVTAESCTGGLIAGCLTEIAGSSAVVDCGYVTYSNEAKRDLLGVPGDMIADYGAVSEPVARAMAEGALHESRAHIAIAVTGIAGPGGGTPMKPVGLVHIACLRENRRMLHQVHHFGDLGRSEIRIKTIEGAFDLIQRQLES